MAAPAFTVYYWPGKGRAENVRLILEAAGVPYENKYPADWPAEKPTLPFGQLPALIINDDKTKRTTTLAQSAAIVRYLARKFNLVAEDPLDAAIADSVWEHTIEVSNKIIRLVWLTPKEEKPAEIEKFKHEVVPAFIKAQTAILEKNGNKGIYAGNKLTYVEIAAYNAFDELNTLIPGTITASTAPALWKVHELVANNANIKAYLASPRRHEM